MLLNLMVLIHGEIRFLSCFTREVTSTFTCLKILALLIARDITLPTNDYCIQYQQVEVLQRVHDCLIIGTKTGLRLCGSQSELGLVTLGQL